MLQFNECYVGNVIHRRPHCVIFSPAPPQDCGCCQSWSQYLLLCRTRCILYQLHPLLFATLRCREKITDAPTPDRDYRRRTSTPSLSTLNALSVVLLSVRGAGADLRSGHLCRGRLGPCYTYYPRRQLTKINEKICITAAIMGFLLLQTFHGLSGRRGLLA